MLQPLLVSTSAISLAAETVRSILKIDDIVSVLRGFFWFCGMFSIFVISVVLFVCLFVNGALFKLYLKQIRSAENLLNLNLMWFLFFTDKQCKIKSHNHWDGTMN